MASIKKTGIIMRREDYLFPPELELIKYKHSGRSKETNVIVLFYFLKFSRLDHFFPFNIIYS